MNKIQLHAQHRKFALAELITCKISNSFANIYLKEYMSPFRKARTKVTGLSEAITDSRSNMEVPPSKQF